MNFRNSLISSIVVHLVILLGASLLMPPVSQLFLESSDVLEIAEVNISDENEEMRMITNIATPAFKLQSKLTNDNKQALNKVSSEKQNSQSNLPSTTETSASGQPLREEPKTQAEEIEAFNADKMKADDNQTAGATNQINENHATNSSSETNSVIPSGADQPKPTAKIQQPVGFKTPTLIYQPPLKYPLLAKRQNWEGTVTLKVLLSSSGKVLNTTVERSSGYQILDQAAQKIVFQRRYQPALKDGQPIDYTFIIEFHWRLKDATD